MKKNKFLTNVPRGGAKEQPVNDNGVVHRMFKKSLLEALIRLVSTPKSAKNAFGAIGAASLAASGYCVYKKDGRGFLCSLGTTFVSGFAYWLLDRHDESKTEKQYQHEENLAKINHPVRNVDQDKRAYVQELADDSDIQEEPATEDDGSCLNGLLEGCSTKELFASHGTGTDRGGKTNWVVDGYMKTGLVNLIVSGGGVGKSTLMVQIAIAVANGSRPEFLPESCCASVKLAVIYYRLEDFAGELEGKYGEGKAFQGIDIKWYRPYHLPEYTLDGLINHLKAVARTLKEDTVVFVDPATKLSSYSHQAFIKGVEEAMAIAKGEGAALTIVASIHLDETKDWNVVGSDDIKGGDKGIQQAGSVTALRRERTDVNRYRYLLCLKEPKGSPKPFEGKVLVCKTVDESLDDNNKYLHYQYDSIKSENEARPKKPQLSSDSKLGEDAEAKCSAPNQKVTLEMVQKMRKKLDEGMKPKVIARKFGVCEKTVRKYLKTI